MIKKPGSKFTTPAEDVQIALADKAMRERIDVIAAYRATLPPSSGIYSGKGRVLQMLNSALHEDWAANRPEGSWLSVKDLAWGVSIPELDVTEILLRLAFHPTIVLYQRHVEGNPHYSLEGARDGQMTAFDF